MPRTSPKFIKVKTRLRLKRRVFPSNFPWQPRCPIRWCEIRPEVLRPTFSGGLPLQALSERSNKPIGNY